MVSFLLLYISLNYTAFNIMNSGTFQGDFLWGHELVRLSFKKGLKGLRDHKFWKI